MKTVLIASLLTASASAFAPVSQKSSSSALAANKFAGEVGAQIPLGFFDPLGFLGDEDQGRFDRLREVEIKHGRIASKCSCEPVTTCLTRRLHLLLDL